MSAEELIAIRDAQAMTEKRKAMKKDISKWRQKMNARESSNELEEDLSNTENEQMSELLKCIEVKMESS